MTYYLRSRDYLEIDSLMGETLIGINGAEGKSHITFSTKSGRKIHMEHIQDCCEYVYLEDVSGELDDLLGFPILMAEKVTSQDPPSPDHRCQDELEKWTFYKLATEKGYVTLRWYGHSNGYYSVDVDIWESLS